MFLRLSARGLGRQVALRGFVARFATPIRAAAASMRGGTRHHTQNPSRAARSHTRYFAPGPSPASSLATFSAMRRIVSSKLRPWETMGQCLSNSSAVRHRRWTT